MFNYKLQNLSIIKIVSISDLTRLLTFYCKMSMALTQLALAFSLKNRRISF